MCNILKTVDRRAQRTKIWDSGYYSAHVEDTFDALFLEFGLGSFSALCKIADVKIFKRLLLPQFSINFPFWLHVFSEASITQISSVDYVW